MLYILASILFTTDKLLSDNLKNNLKNNEIFMVTVNLPKAPNLKKLNNLHVQEYNNELITIIIKPSIEHL